MRLITILVYSTKGKDWITLDYLYHLDHLCLYHLDHLYLYHLDHLYLYHLDHLYLYHLDPLSLNHAWSGCVEYPTVNVEISLWLNFVGLNR
jgi:hypothetical protein